MAEYLDQASRFIINSGYILARNNTDAWSDRFNSDLNHFLFAVASSQPSLINGNIQVIGISKAIFINSTTSNVLSLGFYINNGSFYMKVKCGELSYADISLGATNYPYYWVIYRAKDGDIGVSIGRDSRSDRNLTTYDTPDMFVGDPPSDVRQQMAKFTPVTFWIVSAIDSIYNTNNKGALIIPISNFNTVNDSTEFKKHFEDTGKSLAYIYYATDPSSLSKEGRHSSVFLTGDSTFYGRAMLARPIQITASSTVNYLVPAFGNASRCVGEHALMLLWGSDNDPDGYDSNVAHKGPLVWDSGTDKFLSCNDIFLPVELTDSSDDDD